MLRGIPKCLSPDLIKVIWEMGHGDKLILADAYYPSASSAKHNGSILVRCDGVRNTEVLDAILKFMPLDTSIAKPALIMDLQECDRGKVATPVWEEYRNIVCKYDPRGLDCVGMIERFAFYEAAKDAYAVVATGETSLYGCMILQKGCE